MELKRGEIYYLCFKRIMDTEYPNGKGKFVLVLQEGDYFSRFNTVEVLLITSDKQYKHHEDYVTDIVIEIGATKLIEKSWVLCAQPYPVSKDMFTEQGVWCAGQLSPEKMDEIDDALYAGLCFGLQTAIAEEGDIH